MGARKQKAPITPRQTFPRRCKVKHFCTGVLEEQERAMACRKCGTIVPQRDPNFTPCKNNTVMYVPKRETVQVPSHVDIDCAVCLNSFKYSRMLLLLCNHRFHKRCIMKWFKVDIRCPLCRK